MTASVGMAETPAVEIRDKHLSVICKSRTVYISEISKIPPLKLWQITQIFKLMPKKSNLKMEHILL
jgi:hypothetical protein